MSSPYVDPHDLPLQERDPQLEAMNEAVVGAARGQGRCVTLLGGTGAGKSTVLFRAAPPDDGRVQVLRARGGFLETGFSHGLLRQLFGRLAADPGRRAAGLFDGLAGKALELLEGDGGPAGPGEIGAFQVVLERLSLRRPVILVIDDLHWSDAPSLRVLLGLAHALPRSVSVLSAARPPGGGAEGELLARYLADPSVAVLRLPPLSAEAGGLLLEQAAG
ncbi:ATP-binding protein, partial [Actinocorallia lasiicapitis]